MILLDVPNHIYPAETAALIWLIGGLVVVILAGLLIWRWNRWLIEAARKDEAEQLSKFEQVKKDYLANLAELKTSWQDGKFDCPEAAEKLGVTLRSFVGLALDTGTEFMTLAEFRDFTVTNLAAKDSLDILEKTYQLAFIDPAQATDEKVAGLFDEVERVIKAWR